MNSSSQTSLNFNAAIQLCGGREDIAREIIQMLVNELPIQRKDLQHAFNTQNWETLDYISHKLAGSAAYCGMEDIKKEARELSNMVRQKNFATISTQLEHLQQAIATALNAAVALAITPEKNN